MIESVDMFIALLHSDDPAERHRAAHDTADESLWRAIVEQHPDLRYWVAHNKQVPLSILRILARDPDRRVRSMVAMKRKLDAATLALMAHDKDSGVRHSVARHRHTDRATLERLRDDPWDTVANLARERLRALDD